MRGLNETFVIRSALKFSYAVWKMMTNSAFIWQTGQVAGKRNGLVEVAKLEFAIVYALSHSEQLSVGTFNVLVISVNVWPEMALNSHLR